MATCFNAFLLNIIFSNYGDDNRSKVIYNITDILSSPSSQYQAHYSQKPYQQRHYLSPETVTAPPTTAKRYYIYSHKSVQSTETGLGSSDVVQDDLAKLRARRTTDRKSLSRNISNVLENLLKSYGELIVVKASQVSQ